MYTDKTMAGLGSEFFPLIPGSENRVRRLVFGLLYQQGYDKLRGIARQLLARERPGHTLQATALLHEGLIRLLRWPCRIDNEEHLYHLTAWAMKQALIDHARVRNKWIKIPPESPPEVMLAVKRPDVKPEIALSLMNTCPFCHQEGVAPVEAVR